MGAVLLRNKGRAVLEAARLIPTCSSSPASFSPPGAACPLSTLQYLIISRTCKCIHIHGGTDAKLTVAGIHLTVHTSQSASSSYGAREGGWGGGGAGGTGGEEDKRERKQRRKEKKGGGMRRQP